MEISDVCKGWDKIVENLKADLGNKGILSVLNTSQGSFQAII